MILTTGDSINDLKHGSRKMKVMITGSAGRIGSAIYHLFNSNNQEVIGLDLVASPTTDLVRNLLEIKSYSQQLSQVEVIIHCAALHAPHVGYFSNQQFHQLNVDATMNLVKQASLFKLKHFIFTSTTALYGDASTQAGQVNWITESTTPQARSIYHQTKLKAEQCLEELSAQSGLPITVLQISRCFPEPVNLMALYRLHRGIDARDVASAHYRAVEKRLGGFNRMIISAKPPFKSEDTDLLHSNLPQLLNRRKPEFITTYKNKGWQIPMRIDRVYDASLAKKLLNWESIHGFQSVIKQLNRNSDQVLPAQI